MLVFDTVPTALYTIGNLTSGRAPVGRCPFDEMPIRPISVGLRVA